MPAVCAGSGGTNPDAAPPFPRSPHREVLRSGRPPDRARARRVYGTGLGHRGYAPHHVYLGRLIAHSRGCEQGLEGFPRSGGSGSGFHTEPHQRSNGEWEPLHVGILRRQTVSINLPGVAAWMALTKNPTSLGLLALGGRCPGLWILRAIINDTDTVHFFWLGWVHWWGRWQASSAHSPYSTDGYYLAMELMENRCASQVRRLSPLCPFPQPFPTPPPLWMLVNQITLARTRCSVSRYTTGIRLHGSGWLLPRVARRSELSPRSGLHSTIPPRLMMWPTELLHVPCCQRRLDSTSL